MRKILIALAAAVPAAASAQFMQPGQWEMEKEGNSLNRASGDRP